MELMTIIIIAVCSVAAVLVIVGCIVIRVWRGLARRKRNLAGQSEEGSRAEITRDIEAGSQAGGSPVKAADAAGFPEDGDNIVTKVEIHHHDNGDMCLTRESCCQEHHHWCHHHHHHHHHHSNQGYHRDNHSNHDDVCNLGTEQKQEDPSSSSSSRCCECRCHGNCGDESPGRLRRHNSERHVRQLSYRRSRRRQFSFRRKFSMRKQYSFRGHDGKGTAKEPKNRYRVQIRQFGFNRQASEL